MGSNRTSFINRDYGRLESSERSAVKAIDWMPHDDEAERQVLGKCLIDMQWGNDEIVSGFHSRDFYLDVKSFNGWLFGQIASESRTIDPQSHIRYLMSKRGHARHLGVSNLAYEIGAMIHFFDPNRIESMIHRVKVASRIRQKLIHSAFAIDRSFSEWHRHAMSCQILGAGVS